MKGAEIIIKMLIHCGIDTIFGYPGGYVLDIYDSLARHEADITHYATNDEQSAVFAADGYARSSGRLGVVIATSGPGACNLVTGIACANMDSVPLLAITGNVPTTHLGSDSFQEVDIVGVTMPITKYNHIVSTILELPSVMAKSIAAALSNRKGAVLVDIPQDIQQCDIDITDIQLMAICNSITHPNNSNCHIDKSNQLARSGSNGCNINNRHTDTSNYSAAIELINNSSKVTILCGGGVHSSRCYNEVIALADKLNCPVATTLMGVSAFPHERDNYLGLSGIHGVPVANHALNMADIVITLGARFNNRLLASGALYDKPIIQIDIDNSEHDKNINCHYFLCGDIGAVLTKITAAIEHKSNAFLLSMLNYRRKVGAGDNLRSQRNILNALGEWAGADAIVATDVGEHQIFTARNYCFGRTLLTSAGLGAMGYGLGAIIGGCIATRPKKALLITGDGSFNMSFSELPTAVSLKLPLVIAIFNNGTLGMCKTQQEVKFGRAFMTKTPCNIDYLSLARCMGAYGAKAQDMSTVKEILSSYQGDLPLVIDITI